MKSLKTPKWRSVVIFLGSAFYGVVVLCLCMLFDIWTTTEVYPPERIPSELQKSSEVFTLLFLWVTLPLLFIVVVLSIRNLYRIAAIHDDKAGSDVEPEESEPTESVDDADK